MRDDRPDGRTSRAQRMTPEELFATIWARRRVLIGTFLACMTVVSLLVVLLPRTYRATATLVARGPVSDAALAEQAARTYAALAGNPNVAEQVPAQPPVQDHATSAARTHVVHAGGADADRRVSASSTTVGAPR